MKLFLDLDPAFEQHDRDLADAVARLAEALLAAAPDDVLFLRRDALCPAALIRWALETGWEAAAPHRKVDEGRAQLGDLHKAVDLWSGETCVLLRTARDGGGAPATRFDLVLQYAPDPPDPADMTSGRDVAPTLWSAAGREAAWASDLLLTHSEAGARDAAAAFDAIGGPACAVIPPPLYPVETGPADAGGRGRGAEANGRYVIVAPRLNEAANLELIAAAARWAPDLFHGLSLTLFTDDPTPQIDLADFTAATGASVALGRPRREILDALSSAQAILAPAPNDAQCHWIREAAAQGAPAIASMSGAGPEVSDAETALLIDPARPDDLIEAITTRRRAPLSPAARAALAQRETARRVTAETLGRRVFEVAAGVAGPAPLLGEQNRFAAAHRTLAARTGWRAPTV